jgi:hypothetical protein
MSDLITFSLSQLARALGSVPCPKRKKGSSLAQTGLHHFILIPIPIMVFLAVGVALKGYLGELFGYKLFWD